MSELEELACEIDKILDTMTGAFPATEMIVTLFVATVAGFEQMEKDAEKFAEENDLSKEEVKKSIQEQKEAFKKSMETTGKQYIQTKKTELKTMLAQLKRDAVEIPKTLIKAVADAAMPTMIAPGAPNPASSALRLFINLSMIIGLIIGCLMLTSKILNLLLELGLDKTPLAAAVAAITAPLMLLQSKTQEEMDKADLAECEKAKPEDYKVKDPDGTEIDGKDIEAKTRTWLEIYEWPLSKSSKRTVKRKIKNAADDSDDATWGDIIMGYSQFYDKAIG